MTEPADTNDIAQALTMHLGQALHRLGVPAHELEDNMSRVARRFGLPCHFLATPTYITASFGVGVAQKVYMVRAGQGEMNLEKLSRLDDLSHRVIAGQLPPAEAHVIIDHILASPNRYQGWVIPCAYAATSAAIARLFAGGRVEVVVAGIVGLCIGALAVLAERMPILQRIFDISAAVVSALIAALALRVWGAFSVHSVTLAGLIVLVPGMSLTTAMTELSTGNLVSGTARLFGAAVTFLKLGFGVALGTRLGQFIFDPSRPQEAMHVAGWTVWPALALAALGLSVVLQVRRREFIWILVVSLLGHAGQMLGTEVVGADLGPFVAALVVTLSSNTYARALRRTALVTQAPAILLLVPGSVGYRSVSALLEQDVITGIEIAFSATLTAMALVAGVLLANLLFPARKVG